MQKIKQPSLLSDHGDFRVDSIKIKSFKAYAFIIAIMAVLQISTILYFRYFIDVFNMKVSLGPLLFTPAILYIFQIVTECYGWQYGRQIVWINLYISLLFTLITFVVKFIPLSSFTHIGLYDAYHHLMGTIWVSAITATIAIFVADYVSTVFTAYSRAYFKGGLLWLRLLTIHFVTEMILLSTSFIQMPYNGYSTDQMYSAMWNMFLVRMGTSFALAILAVVVIWVLQNYVEKIVCFDADHDWNLFHWQIDEQATIKIKTTDWKAIPRQLKRELSISRLIANHIK